MKYIIYSLVLSVFLLTSCSDSFLDRTNPATLSYDKFYHTEADFQVALNGCYLRLQSQVPYLMVINEITTDNTFVHPYNNTMDIYMFDICAVPTSSLNLRSFWQVCYQTITYTNMVISRIKNSQVSEASQKVFIHEALFIRALTYFNLVRVYGGVPLYSEELSDLGEAYNVSRASMDETYNFIIKDLVDAQNIDNERNDQQKAKAKGKVSSAAVKSLLGKVYLYKKDYTNAVTILSDVINNSGYRLLDQVADLYNPDMPINDEVIFALNYERVNNQSCPITYSTLPKFSRGILPNVTSSDNGDGSYNLEDKIVASFSQEDKRKKLVDSIKILVGSDLIQYYYTKKYLDQKTTSTGYSASDFIVLRFADVLLTCADAMNQNGKTKDAYPLINAVRNRAGLTGLPEGLSKEQMNDALSRERQKEFICEADRWFDLSFRGIDYLKNNLNSFFSASHTPSAKIENHMILFPIPSDQISLKPEKLKQNPGY